MTRKFVVVRERHYVVAQFAVGRIGLIWPVSAFVENALHPGVRMEVCPFPAVGGVKSTVRVENVRTAEWLWLAESVHGADACRENGQQGYEDDAGKGLAEYAQCFQYR